LAKLQIKLESANILRRHPLTFAPLSWRLTYLILFDWDMFTPILVIYASLFTSQEPVHDKRTEGQTRPVMWPHNKHKLTILCKTNSVNTTQLPYHQPCVDQSHLGLTGETWRAVVRRQSLVAGRGCDGSPSRWRRGWGSRTAPSAVHRSPAAAACRAGHHRDPDCIPHTSTATSHSAKKHLLFPET